MTHTANRISVCEVCGNSELEPVLNIGMHPMCDDLVPIGEGRICTEYPIEIVFCARCITGHQRYQVPKRELFPATYHYRSRFTGDVLSGMAALVDACGARFGDLSGKTVLDVGCNDGSLLDFFRAKGARTLGVEPTDAFLDAAAKGHTVLNTFFDAEIADQIAATHGTPDFITFTNVFAHIEDLRALVEALRRVIGDETIIVIENHYLGAVLAGNQFDTFYHEHPRTYSCTSFVHIAESLGVEMLDVEFPARYGGNVRVFLGRGTPPPSQALDPILTQEQRYFDLFGEMRENIARWRVNKSAELSALVQQHGPIIGKAFPGRAAILVKLLGMDVDTIGTVYERPGSMKIGHYVPGTRIPIGSDDDLFALSDRNGPLLNLAWHIPVEIHSYLRKNGFTGPIVDFISPSDFAS